MNDAVDRTRAVRLAVHFVAFQGAWFACVLGAAHDATAPGLAAVAAVLLLHGALSPARGREAALVGAALGIGLLWEIALARTGLVHYAAPGPWPGLPPPWILALWALFGTLLREPLRWLHGRPLLGALFGAAGGPLSYLGAARLGACRFDGETAALLVLGFGWALVTPLLVEAARRLDGLPRPHAVAWP